MTSANVVDLVTVVIGVIISVVSAYVIPMLKEKLGAERFNKVVGYAQIAVKSANQIFALEQTGDKKAWVTEFLQGIAWNKLHLKLSQEEIDAIIESAVADVKAALPQKGE